MVIDLLFASVGVFMAKSDTKYSQKYYFSELKVILFLNFLYILYTGPITITPASTMYIDWSQ